MGMDIALYPFLLNSVNNVGYKLDKEYSDIQGVYGYNGVLSTSYDVDFRNFFYKYFNEFCIKKNIIAEFIRYNPIIKNHEFCVEDNPIYVLDNVLIDLQLSLEDIWMQSFDNGVRKAVKKGKTHNLVLESYTGEHLNNDLLSEFIKIYHSTMDRNSAGKFYYFNSEYFHNVIKLLPNNSLFSFVKKDNRIISVELNYFYGMYAYGFCGGTSSEFYKFSPNSFLRYELIKVLKDWGIKYYSIGGGLVKNDSKYKFKKSFSKHIDNKFFISKKIHNKKIYSEVLQQWESKTKSSNNKLLKYRCTK
jgi:lipid II:glycine glycyltransferase (peptidoglycan interpeptide bridge formation enzyme)